MIRRLATIAVAVVGGVTLTATPAVQAQTATQTVTFQGRTIDMSRVWATAQVCSVESASQVTCFASEAEYRRTSGLSRGSTGDYRDCPDGYGCIWQGANFQGRRLQFKDKGTHSLSKYSFRDQASSAFNNRSPGHGAFYLIDQKAGRPDPRYMLGTWQYVSNLAKSGWNDRADKVGI
ncbi:peptidase inhibitor family I36 protein [Nonomuraea jiangxiensis]|uniref:Peptidase inhibitor family I36 n=1 Tax=Nonomuraea jiangxiensis TaxID=633440 RepID=A0A1G9ITZ2_9ACTN|nr:peptidase inhibitor family I36 protein [Nonomuraea jiangxiensis]SDL28403.1 Peptidase inhibitor family I36 [Nonomuraea jiangxiensis]